MLNLLSEYKVLIAEDDEEVLSSLTAYLSSYTKQIYLATDGQELIEKHSVHRPDIILCDIQMPKLSGIEAIRQIRQADKWVVVIFISAFSDTKKLLGAIEAGCSGYIVKPIQRAQISERLIEAIKRLESAKNASVAMDTMISIGQNSVWDGNKKSLSVNDKKIELTKKERALFSLLLSKRGCVCTFDEIIYEVWGPHDSLAEKASINNLKNIVKKLRLKLPEDIIKNSYGEGYMIENS